MGNGLRVGRLFGIEIRIDPSWLFIFVLISWSLTSLFASWHPSWSFGTSLAVALVASLLFFASVLVHELAHSAVARVYGIPVRDITLHLFGGVSNIEKEPPTPRAELLIAIVGPIASIGLGMAMLVATSALINVRASDVGSAEVVISQLGPIETLLVWLGPVNVIVGVFNMIPGFPLDGGRVLRAIVWKVTGSLERATRIAGGAGQAVGWLFVALGAAMVLGLRVPIFGTGLTSGLWLALIGLFLRNAAVAHVRGAAVDRALADVEVADLMRVHGAWVEPGLPVRDLVDDWFLRHDEPAYPVIQGDVFLGIVSLDDLRKIGPGDWATKTVRDVMTPRKRLVVTTPTEPLAAALRKLGATGVRQLPALDEQGALAGMLYENDVARWLQLRSRIVRELPLRARHA
ncbi:MAG: site-2 protease family protein [Labilithrix sp.]|nr:site-2 protease family protein [Labilithrix sp.]MBX3221746.1 site-2 protease family protein [Labilithrix sp.]